MPAILAQKRQKEFRVILNYSSGTVGIYESLSQQQQRRLTDYDKLPRIRQDLFLELVDLEKVLVWRLESPWIQVPSRHFAVFHTLVCRAQHRVILVSEWRVGVIPVFSP